MPIPICLPEGMSIREVLSQWAQHLDRGLQEHFGPGTSISRSEQDREFVLFLRQGAEARGEISIRWDAAKPAEISIRPLPARPEPKSDPVWPLATGALLATAAWLALAIASWDTWWDIRGVRGKVFWLIIGVVGWVVSTFGLAFAGDSLFASARQLLDKPRVHRSQQWIDAELWPGMQSCLNQLWERARHDEALARRLACDFSG